MKETYTHISQFSFKIYHNFEAVASLLGMYQLPVTEPESIFGSLKSKSKVSEPNTLQGIALWTALDCSPLPVETRNQCCGELGLATFLLEDQLIFPRSALCHGFNSENCHPSWKLPAEETLQRCACYGFSVWWVNPVWLQWLENQHLKVRVWELTRD